MLDRTLDECLREKSTTYFAKFTALCWRMWLTHTYGSSGVSFLSCEAELNIDVYLIEKDKGVGN